MPPQASNARFPSFDFGLPMRDQSSIRIRPVTFLSYLRYHGAQFAVPFPSIPLIFLRFSLFLPMLRSKSWFLIDAVDRLERVAHLAERRIGARRFEQQIHGVRTGARAVS